MSKLSSVINQKLELITRLFHPIFIYLLWLSILWVIDFCILLSYSLRSENRVALWTVLEIVNGKVWVSFEYKSCRLFSLDVFRIFLCDHCYCGIKLLKTRSNNSAAVLVVLSPILHRTISLVVCFIFMIVLVLSFACD
jgi:hypothetical protein